MGRGSNILARLPSIPNNRPRAIPAEGAVAGIDAGASHFGTVEIPRKGTKGTGLLIAIMRKPRSRLRAASAGRRLGQPCAHSASGSTADASDLREGVVVVYLRTDRLAKAAAKSKGGASRPAPRWKCVNSLTSATGAIASRERSKPSHAGANREAWPDRNQRRWASSDGTWNVPATLLVPQCFDWIEAGRAGGGVDADDYADEHAEE